MSARPGLLRRRGRFPGLAGLAALLALLAWAGRAEASHAISERSLSGVVAMPAVVPGGVGPYVRVDVRWPDGRPASDLVVRVEAFHGFRTRRTVALAPAGPGRYAGRLPVDGAEGLWQGVVRVEGGPRPLIADIAFTVRRDLEADVAAPLRPLGFRRAGPWTAPPWLDHLVWASVLGGLVVLAAGLAARPLPAAPRRPALPFPPWATALGVAGALAGAFGAYWDVAWHVDRGRETFWSPPHLVIYGGMLSVSAALLTAVALAGEGAARVALRHRGLRFTLVAAALTLASAPFDEAWHALFGLDVSIWSPPHLVLLFGSAFSMLGLALMHGDGVPRPAQRAGVVMLAAATLLIFAVFVLEFEFTALDRWHVMMARPRGLYLVCATTLVTLVLASAARAGGPGAATAAAAVAWLLRLAVSLVVLPALGRSAPLLPPVYLAPALGLEAALWLAPRAWPLPRRFALAGAAATGLAYLAHNPLAGLLGARALAAGELWGWFPLAVVAGPAAAFLGLRIGTLARPVGAA